MGKNTLLLFRYVFVLVVFLFVCACAKIDELTGLDNFNRKDGSLKLRKYSGVPLNIPPLVQFILDKNDVESLTLNNNIRKACDYSKIPIQTITVDEWNKNLKIDDNVRVLTMLDSRKLNNQSVDVIRDFVAKGGTLFMPFGSEDKRFSFLIGGKPENDFETDANAAGFHFKTPIFPGFDNHIYKKDLKFFGLKSKAFSNKIKVLATAANDENYPLIVENQVGKGKVIYVNSTYFTIKDDRGLLFSGLLKGLEGIPYPVINTGVMFLDDFPSPLYDIKQEPIKSEMDLTITDYVHNVWWPDLIKISKKFSIDYAAMTTFDYNVNVKPPFLFREWDSKKVKVGSKEVGLSNWLAHNIMDQGHEMAFHGYNHVSLLTRDWKNPDFMVTSLKAAEKKWEVNNFGDLPVTYVPPSNYIDRVGLKQLKKGMPSISFMCSIYIGEKRNGGNREFDFDPYEPELFDFPRISSGFYVDDDLKYTIYSLYMYTGIWTHFLHPDDIFDIKGKDHILLDQSYDFRNYDNLGWYKTPNSNRAMFPEFDKLLTTMRRDFPQIRYLNAKESGLLTNDWRASYFNHKSENGVYVVQKMKPEESEFDEQHWFMYGTSKNTSEIEKHLKSIRASFKKSPYLDGYLYSIRTDKPYISVPDFNIKNKESSSDLASVAQNVKQEHRVFLMEASRIAKEDLWYADYDKNLALEIESLRKQILSNPKIDPKVWIKYAEYLSWKDNADEVWRLLEEHCIKYPTAENVMFSKRLAEIVYYPNELVHEKWINAQILVTPNDKDLLNSYVANFYTPENQAKIKDALIKLLKVDTSHDSFLKYIDFLLGYEPHNAIPELDKIKPSAEFSEYATTIAWTYADENQFQKALEWSAFSKDIDFYSKMQWLIELKDYQKLIKEYNDYIAKNPEDYRVKAQMSQVYHEMGKFKESWILASELPEESADREAIQKMLNTDVIYEEREVQLYLVANYPQFFYPDVLEKIIKDDRTQNGNFVNYDTSFESNKQNLSSFQNVWSYNMYDKKLRLHGFGLTYSSMYRIENQLDWEDNKSHDVFGIQYQYNNPKSFDKLQYYGRLRLEYSDLKKGFIQFGAGANYSKNKSYSSAEFNVAPFENGPSHSKSIYRYQLNIYQNNYFFKYWNTILSLEGSYYNSSEALFKEYYTKESYEGSATGKVIFDRWMEKKYRFQPFIEATRTQASLGKSTIPLSGGYPYWMIDDRFFMGGGLGFSIGDFDDDFNMKLEGAWFNDDYASEFTRFVGNMNYQIFDYTSITAIFEYYLQSKFYANALQLGVKYNLKRKQKK
ncbi:DUF2194 domain-containing protein [Flavobacterium sp.]|uniref:DUF2194 domain-containing protein n=1 Tax=Flavobacterium sp. TaxID=239 RepID=UPI0028BE200D|nr:DUF2194 domain-containing protein [Flavobacterium sp.]